MPNLHTKFIAFVCVLFSCLFAGVEPTPAQDDANASKPKLILDADTANEIDDLYAIIRMVRQDKFELLALNSTQWTHYLGERDSVQASQKLNEQIVRLLGRKDLPTPIGSEQPFGKPWGGEDAKDSPAAQFIIQTARDLKEDQKLYVVCTGASTNLASAIKLAPEIAPKIKAYLLACFYDWDKHAWNKSEFNVRRDLDALDYLLNKKDLELHVMPASVSKDLVFEQKFSFENQARMGPLGNFLTDRWKARFPDHKTWIMWDIAAVTALVRPELATEEQVNTPPENTQRKVWMYKTIDQDEMQSDFWNIAMED